MNKYIMVGLLLTLFLASCEPYPLVEVQEINATESGDNEGSGTTPPPD